MTSFAIGAVLGACVATAYRWHSGDDVEFSIGMLVTAAIFLAYGTWTGWAS